MVQKGKMVAEFETMLHDNLKDENAKDPEVKRREQEKRAAKKQLRKDRKKAEQGGSELVQAGRTKKTAKTLRAKRQASSGDHGGMDHEETWRSWIERNMRTQKEKEEFIHEHLKQKETFIDLDQRIGETNPDFRERKRNEGGQ